MNDQSNIEYANQQIINPYRTTGWSGSFNILPEDRSLALVDEIPKDINSVPDKYLEIWYRFYNHGVVDGFGDKCIKMAYLLRRIMRLHGFPARVQQVMAEYRHPSRRWALVVGKSDASSTLGLTTHAVVESGEWILDFAQLHLYQQFGAMAPKAIVAKIKYDSWQDLGFFGQVRYTKKPVDHPETLNERILYREDIMRLSQEYFLAYRAR